MDKITSPHIVLIAFSLFVFVFCIIVFLSVPACLSLLPTTGLGIAALLIALTVRVLFTFVMVMCAGFSFKEKIFIALAWMPKATVQVHQMSRYLLYIK